MAKLLWIFFLLNPPSGLIQSLSRDICHDTCPFLSVSVHLGIGATIRTC